MKVDELQDRLEGLLDVRPVDPHALRAIERRARLRRRGRYAVATTLVSLVAFAVAGLAVEVSARHRTEIDVHPAQSPTTVRTVQPAPTSTAKPTVADGTKTPNGPLSKALEKILAQVVPAGARVADAEDVSRDPPAAIVVYRLSTGQELRFVRQHFTPRYLAEHSYSAQSLAQLITDPTTDSLTRLPTGSTILRLAHNDSAQQVILARPDDTTINVVFWTPTRAEESKKPPTVATRLIRLDWLTTLVEQKLDNPSSDGP